jgi:hypothetical protein
MKNSAGRICVASPYTATFDECEHIGPLLFHHFRSDASHIKKLLAEASSDAPLGATLFRQVQEQ